MSDERHKVSWHVVDDTYLDDPMSLEWLLKEQVFPNQSDAFGAADMLYDLLKFYATNDLSPEYDWERSGHGTWTRIVANWEGDTVIAYVEVAPVEEKA